MAAMPGKPGTPSAGQSRRNAAVPTGLGREGRCQILRSAPKPDGETTVMPKADGTGQEWSIGLRGLSRVISARLGLPGARPGRHSPPGPGTASDPLQTERYRHVWPGPVRLAL